MKGLMALLLVCGIAYFGWSGALLTLFSVGIVALTGSLAMGTLGFWLLLLMATAIMLYSMEEESGVVATVALLVSLLLLQFFGDLRVFSLLWNHPVKALGYTGLYMLIGGVWSLVKLALFVKKIRNQYDDERGKFLRRNKVTEESVTPDLKAEWTEFVLENELVKPNPTSGENIQRLTRWMMYWPWSVTWWVISDFVKRVFEEMRRMLNNLYHRVTDKIWGDRDSHLATQQELNKNARKRREG